MTAVTGAGAPRTTASFRHGGDASARRWATPMWWRAASYWAYQYRRTWRSSVITSFLIPVLYLAAMGIALGSLIDKHSHSVDGVTYVAYLAPGLLAGTCMQIGTNDATYPVMAGFKWMRTYFAQLAGAARVSTTCCSATWRGSRPGWPSWSTIYLAVMAAFGVVYSPWAILAFPAAVLTGIAFSAPVSAFAATQDKDSSFSTLYRFAIIPMFLFSGTFFPVSQLPAWLQAVAYATPLYHGVALCRDLTLGQVGWADLGHAAYLCALVAVGYAVGRRTFARRLVV